MTEARTDRLWVRIGDLGEYREPDDLGQLAEELCEQGVGGPLERRDKFSVCCDGFRGNNYISLYYGSDVETPVRGVTLADLR
jgi:hypothetical protein